MTENGDGSALGTPVAGFEGADGEGKTEEEIEAELEEEAHEVSVLKWGIVISLVALCVTFLIAHYFESIDFPYLPEAGVAVILGMITSFIFYAFHGELMLSDLKFDFEFFMIWLLPPIIFEAGYNMNRQAFFENIFPTTLYAFLGTLLSTFVVGGIVHAAGAAGLCHPIGMLASLFFGALISATDPVTVLAVFQALGVKVELFSMVFGESVMNDAVAIVLSRTLLSFKTEPASAATILKAVGLFAEIFAGSLIIGVAVGFISAYVYKKAHLSHHADALFVEATMIAAMAWAAYYTAEALELSGIVAILFCGIVMAHYTFDSLSDGARVHTVRLFESVSSLAETFIFVDLGLAVFAYPITTHTVWKLVGVAFGAILVARAAHIVPLTTFVNFWRSFGRKGRAGYAGPAPLSARHTFVLWFSGLRGGVAFALASVVYARGYFEHNEDGRAILQTTLIVAALTIFLFGGATEKLCTRLDLIAYDETDYAASEADAQSQSGAGLSRVERLDKDFIRPALTIPPENRARHRRLTAEGPDSDFEFGELGPRHHSSRPGSRRPTNGPGSRRGTARMAPRRPSDWQGPDHDTFDMY